MSVSSDGRVAGSGMGRMKAQLMAAVPTVGGHKVIGVRQFVCLFLPRYNPINYRIFFLRTSC